MSSKEIKTQSISVVKGALTRKINQATRTLVLIGKKANKIHADYRKIGYRNWLNFEIARSKVNKNQLIAVQLNQNYHYPEELKNAGAIRVIGFNKQKILDALNG